MSSKIKSPFFFSTELGGEGHGPYRPPPSSVSINYDTTIRDTFSAQAAVYRGSIIKCVSLISSPNYDEALAAFLAAWLAISLDLFDFILESDSLMITQALQLTVIT
jgi:hypothetical protein